MIYPCLIILVGFSWFLYIMAWKLKIKPSSIVVGT